jgi:hypothetical protein
MFSLFIIAMFILLYQRSLEKTSLKDKTINQLLKIRQEAFLDYKQTKKMKHYGVMGHRAQAMCNIDQKLSKIVKLKGETYEHLFNSNRY